MLKKQMEIAEQLFGTKEDPEQIPINQETIDKLDTLCEGWLQTEFDNNGEPIAWVVAMPTQRELAERFLRKEINERELLEATQPQKMYDSVYLVSAVTVLEHQRKGLAVRLLKRAIEKVPISENAFLFAWPWNDSGRGLVERLAQILGKEISTPR